MRLAIMEAAGFSRGAGQPLIDELIDELNVILSGPGPDVGALDALKFLGGLDESAQMSRSQIAGEVAAVTGDDAGHDVCDQALSLSTNMFDHPFDDVYYEVIHDLPEDQRRLLFRRAIRAGRARQSMNFGFLAREVAMFEDESDTPLMQEVAKLPDPTNVFPQSEWEGFVIATRYLGRHGRELPSREAITDPERGIILLQDLVHALEAGETKAVSAIWLRMHKMPAAVIIGCLDEMDRALREGSWRRNGPAWPELQLMTACPEQCLIVARRFLASGAEAAHYHRGWASEWPRQFAFQCIAKFGDRSDIGLLRSLAVDGRYTKLALAALAARDSATDQPEGPSLDRRM